MTRKEERTQAFTLIFEKAFNPDAKEDDVDIVLKEGNLLTNVY